MEEKYLTLKLTLSEITEGRYRSRIDVSPVGASDGSGHDFTVSGDQIKAWVAKGPNGQSPTRVALADIGKNLFALVLGGTVLEKYKQCVAVANDRGARLRIGLAVLPAVLTAVPWEYLHDGASFLLKDGQLILRVIDTLAEKPAYFRPIRRLLVVIANPTKAPDQYAPFDADAHLSELEKCFGPIKATILRDPSEDGLTNALRDENPDALYFLGHGRFTATLEGQLVLADPEGFPMYLDADKFAGMVRESWVRFVYLNSCSTAVTSLTNQFSGTAQRLMLNGDIDAVVAMQTPVGQAAALAIAPHFFDELSRGSSPELALARSRMAPDDFHTWGVPVVYTYLGGADDLDRNRLACLLNTEIGTGQFGVILPAFGMGVHLNGLGAMTAPARGTYVLPSGSGNIEVTVMPQETFVFPGDTHAREDVESAVDILGLINQLASPDAIGIYESTDKGKHVTHWFLFGSRSNDIVASLLNHYSPRFNFEYQKSRWLLHELDSSGKRIEPPSSIPAPYGLGQRDYAKQDDLGIIEKISDRDHGRVFFIIAGLGSRATRGCGWYFARHWRELVLEFGARDFGLILRFPGGLPFDHAERRNPRS